jgi:DNA recombination protein RmuC
VRSSALVEGFESGAIALASALAAALAGALLQLRRLRRELGAARVEASQLESRAAGAERMLAAREQELEGERRAAADKLALVERAEQRLRETFEALSSDALRRNNSSFLELAKAALETQVREADRTLVDRQQAIERLLQPVTRSLEKVDQQIQHVERQREGAYREISAQVRGLAHAHQQLQSETASLVSALRAPTVRGQWGELQLRRVVEMAGMLDYCDFETQPHVARSEGDLRPDLVVRMPGGTRVVVDAKTPLHAYLEARSCQDEEKRAAHLLAHARQVRDHVNQLAAKSYWSQFQPAPDFVVMFLPGEAFFGAALDCDPALIEHAWSRKVVVASPTTLIALLRAVAYGWRHQQLAENAQRISEHGRELHDRIATLLDHFRKLGNALNGSVRAYNDALGSLRQRVLPGARRFRELGAATGSELVAPEPIDVQARTDTGGGAQEDEA